MLKAFESFQKASYNHDDFTGFLLKQNGYQAMIETVDNYLKK